MDLNEADEVITMYSSIFLSSSSCGFVSSHHNVGHELVDDEPGLFYLLGEVLPQEHAQSGDQGVSHDRKVLLSNLMNKTTKTMKMKNKNKIIIKQ